MDRGFQADVWKVGDGEHVHHAPGLIGRIPVQSNAQCLSYAAVRAIGADHEPRLDDFQLALVPGVIPLQPDGHGMG